MCRARARVCVKITQLGTVSTVGRSRVSSRERQQLGDSGGSGGQRARRARARIDCAAGCSGSFRGGVSRGPESRRPGRRQGIYGYGLAIGRVLTRLTEYKTAFPVLFAPPPPPPLHARDLNYTFVCICTGGGIAGQLAGRTPRIKL